jgi:hypothetical protein
MTRKPETKYEEIKRLKREIRERQSRLMFLVLGDQRVTVSGGGGEEPKP